VKREINPGLVFDLEVPFDDAAEAYLDMDESPGHQGTPAVLTRT
jgi:hypothetical protein